MLDYLIFHIFYHIFYVSLVIRYEAFAHFLTTIVEFQVIFVIILIKINE